MELLAEIGIIDYDSDKKAMTTFPQSMRYCMPNCKSRLCDEVDIKATILEKVEPSSSDDDGEN